MSAPATGGRRAIVKTRITITLLHRAENPMTDYDIEEVLYEMREGDAVGWETDRDTAPVDPKDVRAELIALGNDGEFFDDDDDAEDEDEDEAEDDAEDEDGGDAAVAVPADADLPRPWQDDPHFPMQDWRYEVGNGDTLLGYRDWVQAQRDLNADRSGENPEGEQL